MLLPYFLQFSGIFWNRKKVSEKKFFHVKNWMVKSKIRTKTLNKLLFHALSVNTRQYISCCLDTNAESTLHKKCSNN